MVLDRKEGGGGGGSALPSVGLLAAPLTHG